jgi:hypothetical protein
MISNNKNSSLKWGWGEGRLATMSDARLLLLAVVTYYPSCKGMSPERWEDLAPHAEVHSHISLPSVNQTGPPLPAQEPVSSNRDIRPTSSARAFLSDIPAACHRLSPPALKQWACLLHPLQSSSCPHASVWLSSSPRPIAHPDKGEQPWASSPPT